MASSLSKKKIRQTFMDLRVAIMADNLQLFKFLLEDLIDYINKNMDLYSTKTPPHPSEYSNSHTGETRLFQGTSEYLKLETITKGDLVFPNGSTPLHEALYHNNNDIARYLIENKINLNTRNKERNGYNEPPLNLAIRLRKYDLVNLMLKCEEINVNLQDFFGREPLVFALNHRQFKLAERILSHPRYKLSKHNPLSNAFYNHIDPKLIIKMLNIGYRIPETSIDDFLSMKYLDFEDMVEILEQSIGKRIFNLQESFTLQQLCRIKIRKVFFIDKSNPIDWRHVDHCLKLPEYLKHYICDLSFQ